MDIRKENQYNQSMGKYKILSTAAGVGSIITTKWGGFIMPLSINNWKFVEVVSNKIKEIQSQTLNIPKIQEECGVELIEDPRFVDFLNVKKGFTQLKCFVAIPHIQLNSFNQIQRKGNPLYESIKARFGTELGEDMFYIPAINFPQWFISANSEIKPLNEWRKEWQIRKCNDGKMTYFVPPRDPNKKTYRKIKAEVLHDDVEYGLLKPVPLILICPNGHISDIPWYKFFCAFLKHEKMDDDAGFELFGYDCEDCSCGGKHNIKWLNSRNQAESWGTLKCSKCGYSFSLAGIMNIKPYCRGERPWVNKDNAYERCLSTGQKTKMQVAMVTSNSIYYASGFSSLYIPKDFIPLKPGQLNDQARMVLSKVTEKYNTMVTRRPEMTQEEFWKKKYNDCDEFIEDANLNWQCSLTDFDYENIKNMFLGLIVEDEDNDPVATYRLTEFEVLTDIHEPNRKSKGLEFNEIIIPNSLQSYFKTIKQVNTVSLTNTQLGFGRVNMPTSKLDDSGKIVAPGDEMKPIFDGIPSDIYVLPANQIYGEGLFFAFDMATIERWAEENDLNDHYKCQLDNGALGEFLYQEISLYGRAKFYLLHTFSHVLMKELEFTCGYPTASLSERLYYSDKMCGVLIYTADGAEGSMGGLVWQGQPRLISSIIESAMKRAVNCSSDPLCWENEDSLNRASCFGCTMVSETSCEYQNMGLDRRALVDEEYGFFKNLVGLDSI